MQAVTALAVLFSFALFHAPAARAQASGMPVAPGTSLAPLGLSNAQMRACRISGGQFLVGETTDDQIGLCQLGVSLVGAIDILNKNARIEIPLSLHNYKRGVRECVEQNLARIYIDQNRTVDVCLYSDGTLIDLDTLRSGKENPRNFRLNRALGLAFPN